ncbi:MAG TPA: Gfo/Idh/MocA family oxidoreductase [Propionibacteriaceae bacterium]|nr:Gfo/Idh/MocA family oxidoreductase [Propionibacteriaceae bacterium]
MTEKLNVAIAGAGLISYFHRRGATLAGANIRGVLASSAERSAAAAAQYGLPKGYASFDDLLADDVDVVHIASPNDSHAPFALGALAAGKHVICEKPLGRSVAEARQMADAAAAAGKVGAVPFVYRFHPMVREVRERVLDGRLGQLALIHGSYLQDWMLPRETANWRVDPAAGGASRAFADIGSHWIDLIEWVTGVQFVEAVGATSILFGERPTRGGGSAPVVTEDSATLLLRTGSGMLANVVVSQVAAGRKNRLWFEIDGSEGSAVFDQQSPDQLWLGGHESNTDFLRGATAGGAEMERLSKMPAGHSQGYADAFDAFIADTYAMVRGEASAAQVAGVATFEDGARAVSVTQALLDSVATGGWASIGD